MRARPRAHRHGQRSGARYLVGDGRHTLALLERGEHDRALAPQVRVGIRVAELRGAREGPFAPDRITSTQQHLAEVAVRGCVVGR